MLTDKAGESGAFNSNNMQQTAMNVVGTFCGILSRPVDLILRPFHGTRYFTLPEIFFSNLMMIFLPVFSMAARTAVSMIPLVHISMPVGLFDIASFAKLYFLLSFIHGIRIYYLMLHPEKEICSEFEGGALPFFHLIPGGGSFWFIRITLEPALILIVSTFLTRMNIFSSGLAIYLQIAALALAMKNFIGWYQAWEFLRILLDIRYAGPIIARLSQNCATDEDLATIHLASFPKNLPPDIREAAVSHIARAFTEDGRPTDSNKETH